MMLWWWWCCPSIIRQASKPLSRFNQDYFPVNSSIDWHLIAKWTVQIPLLTNNRPISRYRNTNDWSGSNSKAICQFLGDEKGNAAKHSTFSVLCCMGWFFFPFTGGVQNCVILCCACWTKLVAGNKNNYLLKNWNAGCSFCCFHILWIYFFRLLQSVRTLYNWISKVVLLVVTISLLSSNSPKNE